MPIKKYRIKKKNMPAHILFSKIESNFYQEFDPADPSSLSAVPVIEAKTLLTHEAGAIQ